MSVNGEVRNGREIGVLVSAESNAAPRAAQVDLVFDPVLLQLVGTAPAGAGRVTVNLAPSASLRFRIIGATGASGSVGIAAVRFSDGGSCEFSAPPPLTLTVLP